MHDWTWLAPSGLFPGPYICDLSDEPMVHDLAPMFQKGYLESLKQWIPADLRERVRFLGGVPYSETRDFYANACVAVFPSVWQEPFGMPVVEAMMSGLPIVVTKSGGMPELVVNGETGFVVQRNDSRALGDALLLLLREPDLRVRMGQAGKDRARKLYTWEKVAERMLQVYCDLHSDSSTRKAARVPAL